MTTLYIEDVGGLRKAGPEEVIREAHALIARRFRRGKRVSRSGRKLHELLKIHLGTLDHEMFGVLYLDAGEHLIALEDLFRGTVDHAAVYPREVVKAALRHGASSIIIYHNHPSGTLEPSPADHHITRTLKDALGLVEVRLLDHLIVADGIYSMAEAGFL